MGQGGYLTSDEPGLSITLAIAGGEDAGLFEKCIDDTQGASFATMPKAMIMGKPVAVADSCLDTEDLEWHARTRLQALAQISLDSDDGVPKKLEKNSLTVLECGDKSCRHLPQDISLNPAAIYSVSDSTLVRWEVVSDRACEVTAEPCLCSMEAGDDPPFSKGFERTGSEPFMATALMRHSDTKRTQRHELESLIWALAWVCEGTESQERRLWRYTSSTMTTLKKADYWYSHLAMNSPPLTLENANKDLWDSLSDISKEWILIELQNRKSKVVDPGPAQFLSVALDQQQFVRGPQYTNWNWADFAFQRATLT